GQVEASSVLLSQPGLSGRDHDGLPGAGAEAGQCAARRGRIHRVPPDAFISSVGDGPLGRDSRWQDDRLRFMAWRKPPRRVMREVSHSPRASILCPIVACGQGYRRSKTRSKWGSGLYTLLTTPPSGSKLKARCSTGQSIWPGVIQEKILHRLWLLGSA